MKVYVATKAHGFSSEEVVCISRTKEGAEFALTGVYPNLIKLKPTLKDSRMGYDPMTGDKDDQAYVREYNTLGANYKRTPDKLEHAEDGRVVLYLVTTAYVKRDGLDMESPWGIAFSEEDAMTELGRFFPKLEKMEDGLFIETDKLANNRVSTVAIRITKTVLED